jgi:hypothetical protein
MLGGTSTQYKASLKRGSESSEYYKSSIEAHQPITVWKERLQAHDSRTSMVIHPACSWYALTHGRITNVTERNDQ